MEMRTSAPITNVFEEKRSNFRTAQGYLATNDDNDTKTLEERMAALEAQIQELHRLFVGVPVNEFKDALCHAFQDSSFLSMKNFESKL